MPNIKYSDDRVVIAFLDKMVVDKDPQIEATKRVALRTALKYQLDSRFEKAVIMALPDEDLKELATLLDEDATDEEIMELFEGAGVNYLDTLNREMKKFREEYLAGQIEVDTSEILAKMPEKIILASDMKKAAPVASATTVPAMAGAAQTAVATPAAQPLEAATSTPQPAMTQPMTQPTQTVQTQANMTMPEMAQPTPVAPIMSTGEEK